MAVSGDTVVVGAYEEDSAATGVNGNQSDNSANGAGAAYVFTRWVLEWPPRLTIAPDGSGGYFIRFTAAGGETYRLQRASSLNGSWSTSATQTAPPSGLMEFHDTFPPPDRAFYRVSFGD